MKEVTITSINRTERQKRDGTGTYESVGIKTKEYGDQFLNGFGNQYNKNWKEGDKVNITVEEVVKDGKKYLNFKTAPKDSKGMLEIKMRLDKIGMMVKELYQDMQDRKEEETRGYKYPREDADASPLDEVNAELAETKNEDEINPDDLPW